MGHGDGAVATGKDANGDSSLPNQRPSASGCVGDLVQTGVGQGCIAEERTLFGITSSAFRLRLKSVASVGSKLDGAPVLLQEANS